MIVPYMSFIPLSIKDNTVELLKSINKLISGMGSAGDSSGLTSGLSEFFPTIYDYVTSVQTSIVLPVAYMILSIFFMFELWKISQKANNMGMTSNVAEPIVMLLVKLVLCKMAVDMTPDILNAIYNETTKITSGISSLVQTTSDVNMDLGGIEDSIPSGGEGLVVYGFAALIYGICGIAVLLAKVIIYARFLELYVYFAIAPAPIATLPSDEMSQIGKNFLKSFTAVALQGTLLYLVLSFYPIIVQGELIKSDGSIWSTMLSAVGYALVLLVAVFMTSKWAKSICNAM